MNITVIMATYNGEKYVRQQLDTILPQLGEGDELIISDDGSVDATLAIIEDYIQRFSSIKLTQGPHRGSTANFASAIPKTSGDIILFSDQDDIWCSEKVETTRLYFQRHKDINLVLHDASFCDEEGQVVAGGIFNIRNPKHGAIRNWLYSAYYGCCIGARREFLMKYVSTLEDKVAFDQYFGLLAECYNQAAFIDKKLILHRFHSCNQTKKLNTVGRIRIRYDLMIAACKAIKMQKKVGCR